MASIYQMISRYKNELDANRDELNRGAETRYDLEDNELYIYFKNKAYAKQKTNKKKRGFLDEFLSLKDNLESDTCVDGALFQLTSSALSNKNGSDTRLCNNLVLATKYALINKKYKYIAKLNLQPNKISYKNNSLKSFLKHYNSEESTSEFRSITTALLKNDEIFREIVNVIESAAIITSIEEKANYYKRQETLGKNTSISFADIDLTNASSSIEDSENKIIYTYSHYDPDLMPDDLSNSNFIDSCVKLMCSLIKEYLDNPNLNLKYLFIPLCIDHISGTSFFLLGEKRTPNGFPSGIINTGYFCTYTEKDNHLNYKKGFAPYEIKSHYEQLLVSDFDDTQSSTLFYAPDIDALKEDLIYDFWDFSYNVKYQRKRLREDNTPIHFTGIPQNFKQFFSDKPSEYLQCLPSTAKLQEAEKKKVKEEVHKEMDMMSDR